MSRWSTSYTDYTQQSENNGFYNLDYAYDPRVQEVSYDPYTDVYNDPSGSGYANFDTKRPRDSRAYHTSTRPRDHTPTHDHRSRVSNEPYSNPDQFNVPTMPSPPPQKPTAPTPEYIAASLSPSTPIHDPTTSRKLLILDLNGTLLLRSAHVPKSRRHPRPRHLPKPPSERDANPSAPTEPDPTPFDPYKDPTQLRPLRAVHPRPYIPSFRQYLFHPSTKRWLDTMVWSSAQPHSVADMVDKAFMDMKDGLVAVWARDTLGLGSDQYHKKTQTTKDLAKPWAALPLAPSSFTTHDPNQSVPHRRSEAQKHSARTTLLLDDSPLKAHLQPWNHLCIKEYVGNIRARDLAVWRAEEGRNAVRNTLREGDGTVQGVNDTDAPQILGQESNSDNVELGKKRKRNEAKKAKRREARKGKGKEQDGELGDEAEVGVGPQAESLLSPTAGNESSSTARSCTPLSDSSAPPRKSSPPTSSSGLQPISKISDLPPRPMPSPLTPSSDSLVTPSIQPVASLIPCNDSSASTSTATATATFATLADTSTPKYDETLLAVIGILDTIKLESNVAGWVRAGGLFGGAKPESRVSVQPKTPVVDASGVVNGETDAADGWDSDLSVERGDGVGASKKRRVSGNDSAPLPRGKNDDGRDGAKSGTETVMWFEDDITLDYWATRGRRALADLGIEAVSGVKG